MRDSLRQYLDTNYGKEVELDKPELATNQEEMSTFKCPRGHEYIAPEPFIIETPDILCNSGPLCIYCYANWLHVNLGAEEIA